jgi:hypothetical protein
MVEFKECQKMTQWWLWSLLLGVLGIWVWGIIYQVLLGHPFGNNPMSNKGLIISSLIPLSVIAFFYLLVLKTEVSPEGIYVSYFPLSSTRLPWDQIQKAEIIKYRFVGYGIRLFTSYGTVYNAKGDVGLLLHKKDGSKLLIGTQLSAQLASVIKGFI